MKTYHTVEKTRIFEFFEDRAERDLRYVKIAKVATENRHHGDLAIYSDPRISLRSI